MSKLFYIFEYLIIKYICVLLSVVFRKDKLNNKGFAPIHFRIIKNRKPSYITSGHMLEEKYWDFDKGRVKAGYKNSVRINAFLTSKLYELTDRVLENETFQRSMTSKQLKEKMYGKESTPDLST